MMRTSRVSQEVSRVFGSGDGSTAAPSLIPGEGPAGQRRSTRTSALAQFAYNGTSAATADQATTTATTTATTSSTRTASRRGASTTVKTQRRTKVETTPDIEDVIPDLSDGGRSSRKRRRVVAADATTVKAESSTPRRAAPRSTRNARSAVKKEEDSDDDIDTTAPATKLEPDVKDEDDFLAPSASDSDTKTTLPVRRKRERKPPTAAATSSASTPSAVAAASAPASAAPLLPPPNWQEVFDTLHKFRTTPNSAASNAAVDTMGCERLALQTASPRDQRFHTLIALMLSSQTKDTTNAVAMRKLQTELPPHTPSAEPGLNLENILAVEPEKLNELIWAVGFHNNKTKYIKAAALICRDQWNSDIPDTFEGLVSLPGVGPKMAHLTLSAAWGRTEGIGVDVHVHRISNMWGWTSSAGRVVNKTKTPEETRKALESWLPRDKWRDINWLMVGLGQTVCTPVASSRKCGDCEIGLKGLCRAADRSKVNAGRRAREMKEEKEESDDDGNVKIERGVKAEVAIHTEATAGDEAIKEENRTQVIKQEVQHDGAAAADTNILASIETVKIEPEGHPSPRERRRIAATTTTTSIKRESLEEGNTISTLATVKTEIPKTEDTKTEELKPDDATLATTSAASGSRTTRVKRRSSSSIPTNIVKVEAEDN